MSKAVLEAVIGKALVEAEFREALLADPDEVLAGFDLNKSEKASLWSMEIETLESYARILLRRPVRPRAPRWFPHHGMNGEKWD